MDKVNQNLLAQGYYDFPSGSPTDIKRHLWDFKQSDGSERLCIESCDENDVQLSQSTHGGKCDDLCLWQYVGRIADAVYRALFIGCRVRFRTFHRGQHWVSGQLVASPEYELECDGTRACSGRCTEPADYSHQSSSRRCLFQQQFVPGRVEASGRRITSNWTHSLRGR